MADSRDLDLAACRPHPVNPAAFNPNAEIPYGLTVEHVQKSMEEFIDFLGFLNQQLHAKKLPRLEAFLMPAGFSSLVGEFINVTIPRYCHTVVKNRYHNGHPDILPKGVFPDDAVLHGPEGVEVKGSRHRKGWQGHNPEDVWLLVFVFDANSSRDEMQGIAPKPFRFLEVLGAELTKSDWRFSGRSATSRRTITASVTKSGYEKMSANWLYRDTGAGT